MRVGFGYDAHRLAENKRLILCGVDIPYEKGLDGHSDADVAIHALMDAMLGAAALGDIGKHFSDKDERLKGISSLLLLEKVKKLLGSAGYELVNADITIIAERPKLAGFIDQMREKIAAVLEVSVSQISIKATTEEGMGFTGDGSGIASCAIVLIE